MNHDKAIVFLKKVFPNGFGEVIIHSPKLDQVCFTHYDLEVEDIWKLIEDYEKGLTIKKRCSKVVSS